MKTLRILIALISTLMCPAHSQIPNGNFYVRDLPVVETAMEDDVYVITVEMDGDGYQFEADCEYTIGQNLNILFFDMNTTDVADDMIVDVIVP